MYFEVHKVVYQGLCCIWSGDGAGADGVEEFAIFSDGFLYARQRRVVLCRALCLSVNFSCSLHNSDTVQDIVMKLGTNINHQTMCREQEPTLHLHFLRNYGPLKFFL